MPVTINGTTGIAGPDGSASTPAVQGTDSNTGLFYPAADTVALSTGGSERMRIDSAGNVGIGVAPNSAWGATRPIQLENGGSLWAWTGGLYGTNIASNVYVNSSTTPLYLLSSVAASQYQQLSGAHKWYSAPSGTADNAITWTQLLAVEKDKSLALQGATSQSGTGITFPATQSASSDANTLDDYEEGTWTPGVNGYNSPPSITYTSQSGTYTKVGRQVTVSFKVVVASSSGGAGEIILTGLPFTASGEHVATMLSSGIDFGTSATQLTGRTESNTWIRLFGMFNNGALVSTNVSTVAANDIIQGTLTYFV